MQVQLIVERIDQFETLQNHPDKQLRFVEGEMPADTCPLATAERHPGPRRPFGLPVRGEPFRIESFGIGENVWIALNLWCENVHGLTLLDPVLPTQHSVGQRNDLEAIAVRP